MAETGRKLGKLGIAVLEHFVESKLGEKFVAELRAGTDRQTAIAGAMQAAADRLWQQWDDKRLWRAAFGDLPEKKALQDALKKAVHSFYQHPTNTAFANVLAKILREHKEFSEETIQRGVGEYLAVLTEELALADADFRENVRGLSDLRMVEILRRVEKLLAGQKPPAAAAPDLRNLYQVPAPPADFVARPKELDELRLAFGDGKRAAISGLTGMGGIGKTVLGLVVAHELAKDYPDAQIFLDLKGTSNAPLSPADAMRYVLHSFEPAADLCALSDVELSALYCNFLADKKVLLFWDNARSAEQVKPLLPPPSCAALITSRWQFPLPGLKSVRLGVMKDAEAEAFLLELCPRIGKHASGLAKLCGCLPLALRIAGSFLAVNADWSLPEYLDRLQKRRLATLASAEDAERDLEAVFAESYETLTEDERLRWQTLSVFPASFDRPAAAAVWDLDDSATHDILSRLCRYSLLDYVEPSPPALGGSPTGVLREEQGERGGFRYSLHDLLRDFALARLNEEESQTAALRHAGHYSKIMGDANQLYLKGGENIFLGLSLFDREWQNIEAGQTWSRINIDNNKDAAKICNWYGCQGSLLDLRFHPQDQIHWLEDALKSAKKVENREAEGAHLGNLGNAYFSLGDACKAIEFYENCLALHREIGDRRGEGAGLCNLGNAYAALGDARKAIEFYEQALVIDREFGDRRGEGADLGNLGGAYAALGDARKAIEFYEQDLVIAREIGDRRGEGAALGNLGLAYAALGDARKAIEFYEQHLMIAREIGDRRGEGAALGNLGSAYAALGDARKAIEYHEKALVVMQEIGDKRAEGSILGNLGNALYGLGEKKQGIKLVKQALAIFEAIESPNAEWARNKLKEWGEK
ncbi:MAG: TPR-repeat-containing protein [Anaerolineaceae bacterium]|nr:MAG: TPR-repeat-containing protein [Anaerolineaceae bacterium]